LKEKIFVGQMITGPDKSVSYEFYAPSAAGYYYYQCDVHPTLMYGDFVVLKESSTR
jgi:plastocyanin